MLSLPRLFHLTRHPYEEDTHHFILRVSDGTRAGSCEFYADTASILEWAERLVRFPQYINDESHFECGAKNDLRHANYIGLRFYVYDASGHTAPHIHFLNRGNSLVTSTIDFSFPIEAASINCIGASLKALMTSDRGEISIDL